MHRRIKGSASLIIAGTALVWTAGCGAPTPTQEPAQQDSATTPAGNGGAGVTGGNGGAGVTGGNGGAGGAG